MKTKVYKQFRIIRKKKGYTLKELSKFTGIPYQRISDIEQGILIPKDEYKQALEEVLGVELFSTTKEDQEYLDLFDDFYDLLFYGTFDYSQILKRADNMKEDSRYSYVVDVIQYVVHVIKHEAAKLEENNLKYIDFDVLANFIYQLYSAAELYNNGKTDLAKENMIKLEKSELSEKQKALYYYQLSFILISQYKLVEARETVEKAKLIFDRYGASIRSYQSNMLLAHIYACLNCFDKSTKIYELCIKMAEFHKYPTQQIGRLYRNLALDYIFSEKYDLALKTLDIARKIDENNSLLILYYVYTYCFIGNYDAMKDWIIKGQNHITEKNYKLELSFWNAYVKQNQIVIDDKVIKKIQTIVSNYYKTKEFEIMFFYIDILCDAYEKTKQFEKAYKYLKIKNKFLRTLINSVE